MKNYKPFCLGIIVGAFLVMLIFVVVETVRAESGFHRVTETITPMSEEYNIVTGVTQVPILNPQGKPTGRYRDRPITAKRTRQWNKKTTTPGGTGVTFINFGSGVTSFFLGRDVKELIQNGHLNTARDYTAVTYLESGVTPTRTSWREWDKMGRPAKTGCAPKYHYSGTPSIKLSQAECDSL